MTDYDKNQPSIYIVGANSRILRDLKLAGNLKAVSGRISKLKTMPQFSENSVVLIFSDPPTLEGTEAMILSVIESLPQSGSVRVIFMSSIASIYSKVQSDFSHSVYSRKKFMAEEFLKKYYNNFGIIRLGLVYEVGGWRDIISATKVIILPRSLDSVAVTSISMIKNVLEKEIRSTGRSVENVWEDRGVSSIFQNVFFQPGLGIIYRFSLGRFILKIVRRITQKFGIFIVSPEDILCFQPSLFRERYE